MTYRHHIPEDLDSGIAGADLSLSQYRALARDANGNYVRAGAGGDIAGVLENNPKQGQHCNIFKRAGTIHPAVTGSVFARDASLVSDAQGRMVAAAGAAGAEVRAFYRAEQASTAADQIVAVRREPHDVRF